MAKIYDGGDMLSMMEGMLQRHYGRRDGDLRLAIGKSPPNVEQATQKAGVKVRDKVRWSWN
jgi:hypothetical protein